MKFNTLKLKLPHEWHLRHKQSFGYDFEEDSNDSFSHNFFQCLCISLCLSSSSCRFCACFPFSLTLALPFAGVEAKEEKNCTSSSITMFEEMKYIHTKYSNSIHNHSPRCEIRVKEKKKKVKIHGQ